MQIEKCAGCGKEVSRYKDDLGNMCFTCFGCFPITKIDIRAEELHLCFQSQYPKRKGRFVQHYGRHKINIIK